MGVRPWLPLLKCVQNERGGRWRRLSARGVLSPFAPYLRGLSDASAMRWKAGACPACSAARAPGAAASSARASTAAPLRRLLDGRRAGRAVAGRRCERRRACRSERQLRRGCTNPAGRRDGHGGVRPGAPSTFGGTNYEDWVRAEWRGLLTGGNRSPTLTLNLRPRPGKALGDTLSWVSAAGVGISAQVGPSASGGAGQAGHEDLTVQKKRVKRT